MKKRDKPGDLVFVLDATKSTQYIFTAMIEKVSEIADELNERFRRALFYYGAVIFRDPVDYKPSPKSPAVDPEILNQIKQSEIEDLRAIGRYNSEEEARKNEAKKLFDHIKYPENINVAIDLVADINKLINELKKIDCDGGHDEPEDWVGALDLALNYISWRDNSKKIIIWISDSNAHGRRYCGFNNHQEEESKLEPLVKQMAKSNIYFKGINIVRNDDNGCRMTLNEMKKIYDANKGKAFVIQDIEVARDPNLAPDGIPPGFMDDFWRTMMDTIIRDFPDEMFPK